MLLVDWYSALPLGKRFYHRSKGLIIKSEVGPCPHFTRAPLCRVSWPPFLCRSRRQWTLPRYATVQIRPRNTISLCHRGWHSAHQSAYHWFLQCPRSCWALDLAILASKPCALQLYQSQVSTWLIASRRWTTKYIHRVWGRMQPTRVLGVSHPRL